MSSTAALAPSSLGFCTTTRFEAVALACLIALSLLPIALVEIPAMVDYPNHLARMSILARHGTAAAHPIYEVAWAPYPNLAMDLLVPPVARVIGVELATKLFYLLSQLLVVGGAMAVARAARGSVVASGLGACLCLYAMPFSFGFINFEFALGLALLWFAAWIALARQPLGMRIAVHALAVATLFVAHLFALGLYGVAIGLVELWRLNRERPPLARAALLVLGMAAPVVVIAVFAGIGGGSVGGERTEWHLEAKPFWLAILNGWSRPWASAVALAVAIPLCLAFRRGWLRLVGPGPWLAAGSAALFLAMPYRLLDTAYVDGRVLLAALLILPAFTEARWPNGRARLVTVAVIAAACLANLAFAAWAQHSYRDEYRALLAAFEAMPRGSRLLTADQLNDGMDPPADLLTYPMYHAATLAVHTRDAFVPTLFTSPGKQPLRAHTSVQHLKPLEGGPVPWRLLEAFADGAEPPAEIAYVRRWQHEFGFLLLLHPQGGLPRPDLLEKAAEGQRFALYRIRTHRAP